jgi:NAD(P)-dependent dehydrogenase (short-subunit alcohol dehydrogenase family)
MSESIASDWRQATDLSGKVVVITGCASGIGRATAEQFAGAGAHVYGGDINAAGGAAIVEQIRKAGGQGTFYPLDLTERATIDQQGRSTSSQALPGGIERNHFWTIRPSSGMP